jgi:hypothetical protein
LAAATEEQARYVVAAREADRRQLFTLIWMFRLQLETLPKDQAHGEQVRKATLWESDDLGAVRSLAASVGMKPGKIAAETATHLQRISDLVASVKKVDPGYGFRWNEFDWPGWDRARAGATNGLRELWESAVVSREDGYDPNRVAYPAGGRSHCWSGERYRSSPAQTGMTPNKSATILAPATRPRRATWRGRLLSKSLEAVML